MAIPIYKVEQFNLPRHIAQKLKGQKVELIETSEGILIKPVKDPIKELRGILQGSEFTTEAYLQQKSLDKEMEQ
jgi:hypothetical protein